MRAATLALAFCLGGVGLAGCVSIPHATEVNAPLTNERAIEQKLRAVADWQLAHMAPHHGVIRSPSLENFNTRGWVMGAFYVGLQDWAEHSQDDAYKTALRNMAKGNQWRLGDRPFHADDQLIGLVYAKLHADDPANSDLRPTRAYMDAILANPPTVDLKFGGEGRGPSCQLRWCWVDALFMAPATWIAMTNQTGDPRYAAYAHKEFWATADYLFDADTGLFYRDSSFFGAKGEEGEKVFWSRGNGWMYGGIANILRVLPADDPDRPRYVALFQRLSARLVALQRASGSWNGSLLAMREQGPETSGTGFFTYGLAWGVNEGLLTGPEYRTAALKGWALLESSIDPSGRVGYVQQVGDRPSNVLATDTQFYGAGAVLMAGVQISRLTAR